MMQCGWLISVSAVVMLGVFCHCEALSQGFPSKPVRIIVPTGASGSVDAMARVLAQKLSERWAQQVVVDNRPGAGGTIGVGAVAKAPPDGYTLLIASNGNIATTEALYKNVPYDPVRDLAPISLAAATPYVLVMHPSFPARSVRDLVRIAREKPDIHTASAGAAGTSHLAIELLNSMAAIKLLHVPYKTSQAGLTSVVAGETFLMFTGIVSGLPLIANKRIKPLAVAGSKRIASLADVPTIAEDGVPGYEASNWTGILAPAKLSLAQIDAIHGNVTAILQTTEIVEHFRRQGFEVIGSTPDYFRGFIRSEIQKWSKVVRDAGVTIN
jgi:tripartite-type tricarboxylate transporter receptor subunit TctC